MQTLDLCHAPRQRRCHLFRAIYVKFQLRGYEKWGLRPTLYEYVIQLGIELFNIAVKPFDVLVTLAHQFVDMLQRLFIDFHTHP